MWESSSIPLILHEKIELLVAENKTQRAIETLYNYYTENFNLKPLLELNIFSLKLKEIRMNKRSNKNYNYSSELEKLKKEFFFFRKKTK